MRLATEKELEDVLALLSRKEAHEARKIFEGMRSEEENEKLFFEFLREKYPLDIDCNDYLTLHIYAAYSGLTVKELRKKFQLIAKGRKN